MCSGEVEGGGRSPVSPFEGDPSWIGKYRVDSIIGRGAVGVVYKAYDPIICRPVAIKALRKEVIASVEDNAGLLARFASEARSAGRCQHPNIVTVYDYVEQDQAPYIVMEYVSAGTLESVTRSGTLLPVRQVGEIMLQLLSALHHAHANGVVHRDVKPANILCPAATSIKVTDFGVARLQDLGLTHAGSGALGTPNYMSPEQFLGREVDSRADVFACGVILYQLLTGVRPYVATDVPDLMRKLLNEVPPPVSSLRPELSSRLEVVIRAALARNPTDRFQSAEQFKQELLAVLNETADTDSDDAIDLTRIPSVHAGDRTDSNVDLSRTMAQKLGAETINRLETTLARSVGPIARLILMRIAQETTDAEMLLTRLSEVIPVANEATRFRMEAEQWLREDKGIAAAQLDAVISAYDIKEAIELLLPLIGPVARVIAEREAQTAIGREDYYEHLARAIQDEGERQRFLASWRGS